jgi:hypothetical protein
MEPQLINNLKRFSKIIVTGPPRSGTTIGAMIIADYLGYEFIDETFFDGGDSNKFSNFVASDGNHVIQTTAFIKDLHTISKFLFEHNIAVVLMKRNNDDILESFENSKSFKKSFFDKKHIQPNITEESQEGYLKHYGRENSGKSVPEVVYSHFYKHYIKDSFILMYDSLKNHKLFVNKEDRRKYFVHIKQVKINDADYITNLKRRY